MATTVIVSVHMNVDYDMRDYEESNFHYAVNIL
jgi:hypothetical protein